LRERYLDYGSRAPAKEEPRPRGQRRNEAGTGTRAALFQVDPLSVKVPHWCFAHYYAASIFFSIFWASQFVTHGRILTFLARGVSRNGPSTSMTIEQVLLMWLCLFIQGLRRYWETTKLMKRSSATMPFNVYLSGMAFYTMVGIAVWIEGSGMYCCKVLYGFYYC
jgi:3-oxo-5-alpha-steroid 4-dehydrogenase 3